MFDEDNCRCDLEIFERTPEVPVPWHPLKPNALRINGVEVLMPADTEIAISPVGPKNLVEVTLTVLATSIKIHPEEVKP